MAAALVRQPTAWHPRARLGHGENLPRRPPDSFCSGPNRKKEIHVAERLTLAALLNLAKLARRAFTRLARRGMTAELLLLAAGVDVDRLVRGGRA